MQASQLRPPTMLTVASLTLLMALPAAAVDINYTAFDLAAGRIEVRDTMGERALSGGTVDALIDGGTCKVKVTAGAITRAGDGEKCSVLWRRREPKRLSLSLPTTDGERVDVVLIPRKADVAEQARAFHVRGRALDTGGLLSAGDPIAVYTNKGWVQFNAQADGQVLVGKTVGSALDNGPTTAFSHTDGAKQGYFRWRVFRGKARVSVLANEGSSSNTGQADDNFDDKRDFCIEARKEFADQYVVCFDATSPAASVELPPQGTILRPNRAIVVAIRHMEIHAPTIQVTGSRGLYTPGIRNKDLADQLASRGPGQRIRYVVTSQVYAPRKPGAMDIKIQVGVGDEVFARATAEMEIEETYSGAIRIGIGGVFGSAVDREYEARIQPGAHQGEVVAKGAGVLDYELVLGFAPFFERGGRGYSGSSWAHFAPYVGLGVVSVTGDGAFDALKSLHIGVEWEPVSSFSIALTGVVRRVTRLADGIEVGSPVNGEVPTVTEPHFGFGVVLNLSPDFFRVGASNATSFMP